MTFENAPVGKLSLELNDGIKPTFVVLDDENYCFGEGYEIPEAIASARKVTKDDIITEVGLIRDDPKNLIHDKDVLIKELAHLAGVKVTTIFNNDFNFAGYEVKEDAFLKAEIAAEKHEKEIVSAMGSYLGDDIEEVSQ